ncbi:hypothetical protein RB614_27540 [Phytohabitans sp. ZYX-F-186]|uniref:DUF4157 domain-containing protein n=1 Tax=Phytohabitans maris TaxID=3071409 RepID=A0ABU0ZNN5_9ACTN|nr:hypothetical protein [Phytohabitans sp. ZYX-F-186]MDQ7908286.1 hypothetical protein [Phytohabitans sp. ZYX-F-186]
MAGDAVMALGGAGRGQLALDDVEVTYTPPPRRLDDDKAGALGKIRRSIYTLYRRLSAATMDGYSTSVDPGDVHLGDREDPPAGIARIVRALVKHLRLPDTRMTVAIQAMPPGHAGRVTLGAWQRDEYFVEIDSGIVARRRDVGAVLAHEVTHVFLQYHDLRYEDEILTDTAAVYLGVGWPLLNAHRTDYTYSYSYSQRLGYLSLGEYGYILGRRAIRFGEDPLPLLTGLQGQRAYEHGYGRALGEWGVPPLASATAAGRRRYEKDRDRVRRRLDRGVPRPYDAARGDGYTFSGRSPLKVAFACPGCGVHVRLPAYTSVEVRCEVCDSLLDCDA